MKKILWIFLVSCVCCVDAAYAQEREIEIHYGEGVEPSYVKNEVIVSFNPEFVLIEAVDDTAKQTGFLHDFVNHEVIEAIGEKLSLEASELQVYKIFHRMTTADSISTTRSGVVIPIPKFWSTFILRLPEEQNENIIVDSLNSIFPMVQYAELNTVSFLQSGANDNLYSNQYSLKQNTLYPDAHINIEPAWDKSAGANTLKVGVYDSGINWNHQDFQFTAGSTQFDKVVGGWNFVTNNNHTLDTNGHGTAVAGIIGASRDNTIGVAGIAGGDGTNNNLGCQLFSMQIAQGNNNFATVSVVANAFVEGAIYTPTYGYGLHVMNTSFGQYAASSLLRDAVETVNNNEVTLITAKGNDDNDSHFYPATYRDSWVLSTGASGNNGERMNYTNGNTTRPNDQFASNFGKEMDLIAPGSAELIKTTSHSSNTSYTDFWGTSAAAPHVTGVVGLMQSYFNNYSVTPYKILTPEDAENILQRTAKDRTLPFIPGYDNLSGWGLLNAGAALNAIDKVAYDIVHYDVTTSSSNAVKAYSDQQINITTNRLGLARGNYIVDIYKVTKTVTISHPTLGSLIDVWTLSQPHRTDFITFSNPINIDRQVVVESRNGNQVNLVGYVYHIKYAMNFAYVNKWYPFNLNTTPGKMAYSAYVSTGALTEPGPGGGGTGMSSSMAFPNPTMSSSEINYELTSSTSTTISLVNSSGIIVQNMTESVRPAGLYSHTFDLATLPAGMYLYQIVAGIDIYQGKISKF